MMDKLMEAIATMERARDDAIEDIAAGNTSYAKQLEEADKALKILYSYQKLEG